MLGKTQPIGWEGGLSPSAVASTSLQHLDGLFALRASAGETPALAASAFETPSAYCYTKRFH